MSSPETPMTLTELDAVDPASADRIRAEMGLPLKHTKPAKKATRPARVVAAAAAKKTAKKATAKKTGRGRREP